MKKWEYAMLFVSLDAKGHWTMRQGTSTLEWEGIYNYFNSLGNASWELVSVVSKIGDTNPQQGGSSVSQELANLMAGPRVTTMTQHKTGTIGYLFSFKRPVTENDIYSAQDEATKYASGLQEKLSGTVHSDNSLTLEVFDDFKKDLDKLEDDFLEAPIEYLPERRGLCFIATATMGNENHPYVRTLRKYRDLVLSKSTIGRTFIRVYYFLSPPLAKLISKNQRMRKISLRLIILPAYKFALKGLNKKIITTGIQYIRPTGN